MVKITWNGWREGGRERWAGGLNSASVIVSVDVVHVEFTVISRPFSMKIYYNMI